MSHINHQQCTHSHNKHTKGTVAQHQEQYSYKKYADTPNNLNIHIYRIYSVTMAKLGLFIVETKNLFLKFYKTYTKHRFFVKKRALRPIILYKKHLFTIFAV